MCTLVGHSDNVWSVAFSLSGKRVVSGSFDNLVKIWNVETGAEVSRFVGVRPVYRGDGGAVRAFAAGLDLEVA